MNFRFDKNIIVLSLGIFTILIAMAVVMTIAVDRIHSNIERIDSVVHIQNTKIELVTIMVSAARERTLIMLRMLQTHDPFLRDDLRLNFDAQASTFIAARMKLLNMNLTNQEKHLLDEQGKVTAITFPVHQEILDLLMDEYSNDTIYARLESAMPNQDLVVDTLSSLLVIQQTSINQALEDAGIEYRSTIITMLLLAISVFIACVLVAFYVIRYTTNARIQLFKEKERAQVTLHSIGDGVITTDARGCVDHINTIAEYLTGWQNIYAQGKPSREVCRIRSEKDQARWIDPVLDVVSKKHVISSNGNAVLHSKDDCEYAIEYTASPIFDDEGNVNGTIFVFKNVTEMRALNNALAHQARHDSLTNLINRAEFELAVEYLINDARQSEHEHVLCYLDIDQFKVVNDTCGHIAGDELIKQLADTLRGNLRETDIVGRLGGDEFGILFQNCAMDKTMELMEAIRENIHRTHFAWNEKSFNIAISAGLVVINKHSGSLYDLLSAADSACYAAKDGGRNRIHIYKEDDASMVGRVGDMQWVHRLTKSLNENKFCLFCQSIQSLTDANDSQNTCEILVRLEEKAGCIIPPMAFIPAAERYNLMTEIDQWVISNALSFMQEHAAYIISSNQGFTINISAQSLCDSKFLAYVQDQIKSSKISPSKLCFEITETTAIANLSKAQKLIATLKEIGCKFSLDDFGSGLSSFAYLKNLQVDFLKIDGCFIRNIAVDKVDLAMVKSINEVGHLMDIKTIAEYVETEEILHIVKSIGVDYAQGYYVNKPIPLGNLFETTAP